MNSSLKKTLLVAQAKQSGSMHVYCHCRLTGSKAASDRMVYGAMGAASSGTMTLASKSIKKYCTPGTVETVKSYLHYPGLLH